MPTHCKESMAKIGNKYSQKRNSVTTVPLSTFMSLPILLQEKYGPILGIYKSLTDTYMNVEIGTDAEQFPEKEFINGIFLAVQTEN